MNIAKRTKYIILLFVILATFTAVVFGFASRNSENAGRIIEERHALSVTLHRLNIASDAKVRLMRFVAVTGGTPQQGSYHSLQYANYRAIIRENLPAQTLEIFLYHNTPQQEIDLLEEIVGQRYLLNEISEEVFRLRDGGYFEDALNLAHSPQFSHINISLGSNTEELLELIYNRTQLDFEEAQGLSETLASISMVSAVTIVIMGLVSVAIMFYVASRKFVRIIICLLVAVAVINLAFLTRANTLSTEVNDMLKEQHTLISTIYDLERTTETLTRFSRYFAVTGHIGHFQNHHSEINRGLFGQSLNVFILSQASQTEINAMFDLVSHIATTHHLERNIMQEQIERIDENIATQQLFGESFEETTAIISPTCQQLRHTINTRTEEALQTARASHANAYNVILSSTTFLLLAGTIGAVIKVRRGIARKENAMLILVKKVKNVNIKTSLYIAFTAIILALFAQILTSTLFNNNIRNLHNHNSEFTIRRSEILLEFHRELTNMRLVLAESLLNPIWMEVEETGLMGDFEQRLSQTFTNLNTLAEHYKASIVGDPIFPMQEYDTRVFIMSSVMEYIRTIYSDFEGGFFINGNVNFAYYNSVGYDVYTDIILGALRTLNQIDQEIATENIMLYTTLLRNASIAHLVITIIIGITMPWFVIKHFNEKMKNLQENVEAVAKGDFDHISKIEDTDEISHLFKEVMENMSNVVKQVNHVITRHSEDDNETRIDTNHFQGSYLEMVLATNRLLDAVDKNLNALKLAEKRNQIMLDGSPTACFLIDEDFTVIDCNSAATNLLKFLNKEETLFRSHEVFTSHEYGDLENVFISALESGYEEFSWKLSDARGKSMPVHITFTRFLSNDKKIVAAYIQDMTYFTRISEQQELIAIAQENNQAKSRFLARMSHELRTPLTAVLGISELQMHNKYLSMDVEEAFAKIYTSASGLLGIVNDILDLSKIEAGKMDIISAEYDSASLFNDVAQLNLAYLGSKELEFVVDVEENVPALMKGDELRIKQVMNNVLSNAFKYTDQGSVKLNVKVENSQIEGVVNLIITVEDTGKGMNEAQLKAIFEDYTRFHTHSNELHMGTGLGMSIAQSLLSQMNGTIAVVSEIDKGTSVTIVLPQILASSKILGKETSKSLRRFSAPASLTKRLKFEPEPMPYGKVLIVDDVDANIYVAKGILELYELNVETCSSGKEAIKKVQSGKVYDIIFMDQMMPEMTGAEATAIIRETFYTQPIVALTANALVGQADEFLKNGFDGFLSKPIETTHLNAVLHKFIKDKHFPGNPYTPDTNVDDQQADEFFGEYMMSSEIVDRISKDFLATQRYAAKEIAAAHQQGDIKTAERLAHTLKGLAALINENDLTTIAAEIEMCLRVGEDVTDAIKNLEDKLDPVIESLLKKYPNEYLEEAAQHQVDILDKDMAKNVFDELEGLLRKRSSEATNMLEELSKIPDAKELASAVKSLDFRQALKILAELREKMEI